ncbi:MAG: beta-Ala-His dipeptidase [Candidatus Hodarchaeota archaeon]
MVLENLEPKIVWNIFENVVASTPRPSKHEEKIRQKIKDWIFEQKRITNINFKIYEDNVGNLLIKRPTSKGLENSPSILLQGHLDMICVTNRSDGYNFFENGIPLRIQDNNEWIDADRTSLGADNGIGLALALSILIEKEIEECHGPIEVLFTVNEEDGFTGAINLDVKTLNITSKHMINLDNSEGEIVIGSVCGRRTYFRKKFEWLKPKTKKDLLFIELAISGLLSGHSGGDIHLPRANANKLVARMLSAIIQEIDLYICNWNGGIKGNIIPSESKVRFAINLKDQNFFENLINKEISIYYDYYKNKISDPPELEPNLKIEWETGEPEDFLSLRDTRNIIYIANIIPHGVIRKSPFFENFVETSNNFGPVKTDDNEIEFQLYPRSIVRTELDNFCRRMIHLGELTDWQVTLRSVLPEWKPRPESKFLSYVKEQYEAVLKRPVKINLIHGGLETGMISEKIPEIDMVSIGPKIIGVHTVNEKLNISDVGTVYESLIRIIKNFPNSGC